MERVMADRGMTQQAEKSILSGKAMKALGFASLIALAGCQSIIPRGTDRPGPQTPTPTPTQGPIDGQLPSDLKHHRIALLLPMTGRNAGVGQSLANATTLALLDTKAANIRMTTYDTANGAAGAARKAIADGNKLILGPLLGGNVLATARVARPARVPIISFSNDVGVGGNNVFLLGHVPSQSISRVVSYAKSRGLNRFAGLVPNGIYGQRASSALLRSVKDAGGTVVSIQNYARTVKSVNEAARKLDATTGYDALLVADSGKMAMRAVPIVKRNGGSSAKILGTELWNTENGLVKSAPMAGSWFASVPDGVYRQYAKKYRTRFGKAPFRLSSLGYDAVLLTVRVARDWKVGSNFPTSKLTDKGGFSGIDGAFRFQRNGISQRMLEVQQVNKGSISIVSPAPRSFKK